MTKIKILTINDTDYKIYSQYISITMFISRKLKLDVITNNNFDLFTDISIVNKSNSSNLTDYIINSSDDYVLFINKNYVFYKKGIIKYLLSGIKDNAVIGNSSYLFINVSKSDISNVVNVDASEYLKSYYDDEVVINKVIHHKTKQNIISNVIQNKTPIKPTIKVKTPINNKQKVNILIRAFGNNEHFNNCYDSIRNQAFSNYKIIVSYESDDTLNYLKQYQLDKIIHISPNKRLNVNRHWNILYDYISDEGYTIQLNESNSFINKNSLLNMMRIASPNKLFIFKNKLKPHLSIPSDDDIRLHNIVKHRISFNNILFNNKYKSMIVWNENTINDYNVIMDLHKTINNTTFVTTPILNL